MEIRLILYVLAAVILIVGAVFDHPRFGVTRCIALALGLVVLAQVVP